MPAFQLLLSCRHAVRGMNAGLDRRLSFLESLCLGLHRLSCRVCRRYHRQTLGIRNHLAALNRRTDATILRMPPLHREEIRRRLLVETRPD